MILIMDPTEQTHRICLWYNYGKEDEIHMQVSVNDEDYQTMLRLVETEHLTSTQAYEKMKQLKKDNISKLQSEHKRKITKEEFLELIAELELKTGLSKLEIARNLEYLLKH